MNLFRVALCFSGQSRYWKYCLPNIKNFFSLGIHPETKESIKYDYFIHTWDINHYRHNTNTWNFSSEVLSLDDQIEMKKLYNPIHIEIENFKKFKDDTQPLSFDPMFYSFMKSIHYKREYELKNDFEYDIVIKIRFDAIYNTSQPFIFHKIEPMVGYTCTPISKFINEFHYNNFDDVIFYGDSKTMDLLSHTYRIHRQQRLEQKLQIIENNEDPSFHYGPGCLLYNTMVDMSIHPHCFRSFPWYVVRRNVAESGLDPISNSDWESVKKLCMDWYR